MKYIFYLDQREENMYLNYFIYTLKNWPNYITAFDGHKIT